MIRRHSADFVDEAGGEDLALFDPEKKSEVAESAIASDEVFEDLFQGLDPFTSETRRLIKSKIVDTINITEEGDAPVFEQVIEDTYEISTITIDLISGAFIKKKTRLEVETRIVTVAGAGSTLSVMDPVSSGTVDDPQSEVGTGDY